jgi:hypothetical protein
MALWLIVDFYLDTLAFYALQKHQTPSNSIFFITVYRRIKQAYPSNQCCGAENISLGSGESQIRIAAPAPAPDSFTTFTRKLYHNS